MYHHRYQPQKSHLANKNNNAFASNNQSHNSNINLNSAKSSHQLGSSTRNQNPLLVKSSVTSAAGSSSIVSPTAASDTTAHPNSISSSGGNSFTNSNSRYSSSASAYSSPFSSLPKQFVEERQDVIFRRVRGILNKITPETFDKLTKELVNVGLDSPRTLRGVIYLLFDKALKDLKYSSLYAKLCQELSEKAPNFEQEPGPNTFCKFLISKCEDEFERRRKATEDFDSKNELTDEEFEQKTIAKQKMLGNIKFICELGKKRLLQEEILHECIRGLLSKKRKERPIQDQAQDLECLCQIMRTIGSLLDVEASKNLMNQYFERIDMFSKRADLPSRIRFMLRDVIDLRNNNWRPRPYQREDNVPQPLSRLREELGYTGASPSGPTDKLGNKNLMNISDLSRLSGNKLNSLLLDDEPSFTTTTDFHWGSPFLPDEPAYDLFSSPVPSNKSGSRPGLTVNAITITKPVSTNASHNSLDISNLTLNQSKPDIFNDYKYANVNNRIDPFCNSFKVKSNSNNNTVSNNNNERRPNTVEENQHPDFSRRVDNHRNMYARGTTKEQNHPKQNTMSNIDGFNEVNTTTNLRTEREGTVPHQSRGNAYQSNFHNATRFSPIRNDHQFLNTKRSPFEDSPRPPSSAHRVAGVSTNNRQPPAPMNPNELMPPPPPPPPLAHPLKHNVRNPVNHQVDHTNRYDLMKPSQVHNRIVDNINYRERRSNRGPVERHDGRQQFSGASYRLPGRERHPPPPPIVRNKVPDSELSQNWRADSASTSSKRPEAVIKQPAPVQSTQQSEIEDHSFRPGVEGPTSNMRDYKVDNLQSKDLLDDLSSVERNLFNNQEQIQSIQNEPKLSVIAEQRRSISPTVLRRKHPPLPKLDDDAGLVEGSITTSKVSVPRRDQDNKQPNPHSPSSRARRPDNRELKDRKDAPRKPVGPIVEFDGRVFQRPYQNDTSSLERRNHKPIITRNQSFDAPNKIESKKAPIWRKDGLNNPTVSVFKDTTSVMPNPFLAKAPTRITDSDFSLRPSHNLAGRTPSSGLAQAHKVVSSNTITAIQAPVTSPATTIHPDSNDQFKKSQDLQALGLKIKPIDTSAKSSVANSSVNKTEPLVNQFMTIFSELFGTKPQEINRVASKIKELKVPKPHQVDCLVDAMKHTIVRCDRDREITCKLLAQIVPATIEVASLINAFQVIFEQLQGMEIETPKVKSLVAGFLSQATIDGLITIGEVANMLIGGKHHPLFLLFLQKLEKTNGKGWLSEKFIASKVNLIDMLPEVDRSKDRLAIALKDRCLGFLDPMLTIEPDLWEQMRDRDPAPTAVYRWIKDNIDQSIQNTTTFAHVFVRCLLRYIHNASMERVKNISSGDNSTGEMASSESQSNKSSPTNAMVQALGEHEEELLSKYQHILQAILKDKPMQLASLYALQSFYHSLDFPKGALLRWFHLLYDMSIVDDDVYFTWKEEINDKYPGKGQALFQVNTWLHWLAEAESEEEDD